MTTREDRNSEQLARAVRRHVVEMAARGQTSHVASGLSIADILAVLYAGIMHFDPSHPMSPTRDRFILSKGHAGAAIYATLAESGYFPIERLETHGQDGSMLSGHVTHVGVPGIELSTGSLGHGLSVGAGMALNSMRRNSGFRTYVALSDGECDEGSVWEAALFAAHHRLACLVAVIDYNKMQSLASTYETLDLEPFAAKWRSFGWDTIEVGGHDHSALKRALSVARGCSEGPPRCVIAHTTKGRGVSFMERSVLWHYRSPNRDELAAALAELGPDVVAE